jgi:Mitochondrial carrier protein
MEKVLAQPDPSSPTYESDRLLRSAIKSGTAGIAGAALTNPLDVIRNEQFKTHQGLRATAQSLYAEMGLGFMARGLTKNMVAVALPVGCTIFFTDMLIQMTQDHHLKGPRRE